MTLILKADLEIVKMHLCKMKLIASVVQKTNIQTMVII